MGKIIGLAEQGVKHPLYRADGTAGTSPVLVLPESPPRSYLVIQNVSDTAIWLEFGSARAHATLTSGAVTSVSIDNAGFNFTLPPIVEFFGGGNGGNSSFLGLGTPGNPAPSNPAQGFAVLSGGVVASITVTNPGSGYVKAPYVFIRNDNRDPYGCADPSASSGSGLYLASGQGIEMGPNVVTTDSIAAYCASNTKKYTCLYAT